MERSTLPRRTRRVLLGALGAAGGLLAGGCGPRGADPRLLSQAPLRVVPVPAPAPRSLPPVQFPADEGPHASLAEWWYYTGHLYLDAPNVATEEYGFELVFFRGVRGDRPPGYAAHFAVTDVLRRRFRYDQRQDIALNERADATWELPIVAASSATSANAASRPLGTGRPDRTALAPGMQRPAGTVARLRPEGGFDLALGGWSMQGLGGRDTLFAEMPGYTLDVQLLATRPPALHLGDPPLQPGLISFGPAGYSYYYSRTRMEVQGTLSVDGGPPQPVRGIAWMDHQWGDFLVLGGGGWDWFAANLFDGRDITLSLIRNERGETILAYGTLIDAGGRAHHLPPSAFRLEATGTWTSPHTGIIYPSGWRLRVPTAGLDLLWTPLLRDQELDTRPSTGVIYWEGAVVIQDAATGAGTGRGYVELTGYSAAA